MSIGSVRNSCQSAQKGRFKLSYLNILNSILSYAINVSFDLYTESQLWALSDIGKLYFPKDMLQKVFVLPTVSLSTTVTSCQAPKLLDND